MFKFWKHPSSIYVFSVQHSTIYYTDVSNPLHFYVECIGIVKNNVQFSKQAPRSALYFMYTRPILERSRYHTYVPRSKKTFVVAL